MPKFMKLHGFINPRSVMKITIVCGATLLIISFWTLQTRFSKFIYSKSAIETVPARSVAIVFGAGYWPDGRLSMVLQDRLDAALELYQADKIQKLLFSGDNRIVDYNEPEKMLEYALANGIPREDVVLDYAGRRTYDTCYRARDIFGVSEAIVVTQRFHLPRTLETCKALGIAVDGYIADRQTYPQRYITWYWIREIPALWRAWLDLYIFHPKPILGEPLPILGG